MKAFTLVELAIVLVVIGIIAAMAIAGTDVLSTAQVRGEIGKISKIEAALATYRNDNARFPKITSNVMDIQALTRYGISKKELRSKYAEYTNRDAFEMRMCSIDNESYLVDNGSNVCLIFGTLDNNTIHDFFICGFENLFDDKDVRYAASRQVRLGGTPITIPTTDWGNPKDYNCDKVNSTSYHIYTYKIF